MGLRLLKIVYSFSAGIAFKRQILKSVPLALKGLTTDMRCPPIAGLMLVHPLRHWLNIEPMIPPRLVGQHSPRWSASVDKHQIVFS